MPIDLKALEPLRAIANAQRQRMADSADPVLRAEGEAALQTDALLWSQMQANNETEATLRLAVERREAAEAGEAAALRARDAADTALHSSQEATRAQRVAAAKQGRAKDPMRARIITMMKTAKADGMSFPTLFAAWLAEPRDGLRLTHKGEESYGVDDEDDGDARPTVYTFKTLQRRHWPDA